jgi:uncharacterized membrane protein
MSLGIAIFASVVLILLVYNQQFRKAFFWIAGVGAVLTCLVVLGMYLYRIHKEKVAEAKTAKQKIRVQACWDRFPKPEENYYVDANGTRMDVFDVVAECEKNPDVKLQTAGPWVKYQAKDRTLVIRGGDTLKLSSPQNFTNGVPDFFPVVFLANHQAIVFQCGDLSGKFPKTDGNVVVCQ